MEHYANISGGKDSTAMALHLMEEGIPFHSVFADTGWESRETYDHLRELEKTLGPIAIALPRLPDLAARETGWAVELEALIGAHRPSGMIRWSLYKGLLPNRRIRWCTRELKIDTIRAWLNANADPARVSCIGIRAEESEARAKMPEREMATSLDCMVWRPILKWTEQDVIDIHHRHGLAPNPLYLRGARRVGCYPCIHSRKDEVRRIADSNPERIEAIRLLEKYTKILRDEKLAERGETAEVDMTWFRLNKKPCGIDQYVEWARTARGGRQFALFTEDDLAPGCVRWGLCEGPADG